MRRRSRTGASLFAIYAIASLIPVSALGAVLIHGYQEDARADAREQGHAQAAVIEQMAIGPALRGADLEKGLTSAHHERLRAATDLAVFHGSVLNLRVLSFGGNVEFSDDGSVLGAVSASDAAFRSAAAGRVDTRIVSTGPGSSSMAIRVLQPIIAESSGQAIGVLEVYLPYDEIAAKVAADTRRTIERLALGLVALYGVLALISWWTTSALRRHAADHEHQALHDPLTGLPNRELFRRVVEEELAVGGGQGALVLVDLDHFKEVNDTLGHHAGDELLRVVARRLSESLRTDDTVARLGGDEFGVVLPGFGDQVETIDLLTRVRQELAKEVTLDGVVLTLEASFGVCFYPSDGSSVEALLQHADAAMYQGKHGPTGVVVYEPKASRPAMDALVLQRELREALERDELVLHYQPKVELSSGRITSVEALVRWQHPVRGLLPPMEFLPVAERSELIEPLTSWVIRRALSDCTEWTRSGHDWAVAVNVSARNLSSLDFVDSVVSALRAAEVPAHRLHLEITETALAFNSDLAQQVVAALASQGIVVAVDDFGVGFTGLAQLRTLAAEELKIDRTFISDLLDSDQDRAIVRSVIELGHSLGCGVTAEGVETQDVADWLVDAGCDHGQGYLWLRPAPWPEIMQVTGDAPEGLDEITQSVPLHAGLAATKGRA